jgi:hypothetical protein
MPTYTLRGLREQLVYVTVKADSEDELYGLIDEFAQELDPEHPSVVKIEVAGTYPEVYGVIVDNLVE